jgi:exopolysaccharide production protein ExoY
MENVQARAYSPHGDTNVRMVAEIEDCSLTLVPVLDAEGRIHSWSYRRAKRMLDILGATVMVAMALVPGLLIAAGIVLTSKGPVFYRELRVGRGGRLFRIWKFRSMSNELKWQSTVKSDCTSGTLLQWRVHKQQTDPRVTRVGTFLRRWSLDEIPQVINVLMGDMSLIGPRPVVQAEMPMYEHLQQFYLAAFPGMSGLWQVSGRSNVGFSARANLDASYVQNWSLRADFIILVRTIPAVLKRVGAR